MNEFKNLKELIKNSAKQYNQKILYKENNKTITYKEFQDEINYFGTALIRKKFKNKKIGIISENRYEWEISYFAISCGVGVVVPIDTNIKKEELINIIKLANIDTIICSEKYYNIIKKIKNQTNINNIILFDVNENNENNENNEKTYSYKKLVEEGKKLIEKKDFCYINENIDEDILSFIYFTSGTTEKAKAVMLSHKNICSNIINASKCINITKKDKILVVLPLNHVLEGIFSLITSIYKGATRIFNKDLKEIINDIEKHKITFMFAVPAIYEYLYNELTYKDKYKKINKNINMFFSGGATLREELKEKYKKIGINLIQGYGLTENSPVVSIENIKKHKKGSVGKIIQNIEYKIEEKDIQGVGELALYSKSVMLGYYNNEIETNKYIKNGWLYTGDLAQIDNEGYLFLKGRKKDIIVLPNGQNIYPQEIEEKINKIRGVKESLVYEKIKNSDQYNVKICAKIVYSKEEFKKYNSEEIRDFYKSKIKEINDKISNYKNIQDIEITEKKLLRNSNGKIIRNKEKIKNQTNINISEIKQNELKIKNIIGKKINLDCNKIKENMELTTDLGIDSLEKVSIIFEIEKNFNVKIPIEKRKNIKTVKNLLEIIK